MNVKLNDFPEFHRLRIFFLQVVSLLQNLFSFESDLK